MDRSERRVFRLYFAGIGIAVAASLAVVFLALAWRSRQLADEAVLSQARALFGSMAVMRQWNAWHSGVYTQKRPETPPNPFLARPEVLTRDGEALTFINPSTMTREISDMSGQSGGVRFRITSLKLVNPANAPTPFEQEALRAFALGEKEFFATEEAGSARTFRYMAPLATEESCLPCHAAQGYRVGEPRGGISVSFDVSAVHQRLGHDTRVIAGVSLAAIAVVTAMLGMLMAAMRRRLAESRERLRLMAETDALTGLANRRRLMERLDEEFERARRQGGSLACIMLDLDHFKAVNDTHGHQAGDAVLAALGAVLRDATRAYDVPGRLGGEEFLVVAPGMDREDARALAGRLRRAVAEMLPGRPGIASGIAVTASLGVTAMESGDASAEALLRRADEALYAAKAAGRDRVEAR